MLKTVIVKRKKKIYCDCCGVLLRGVKEPSRRFEFEFYLHPAKEGEKLAMYRFRDICMACRELLVKLGSRVEKRLGANEKRRLKRKVKKDA